MEVRQGAMRIASKLGVWAFRSDQFGRHLIPGQVTLAQATEIQCYQQNETTHSTRRPTAKGAAQR